LETSTEKAVQRAFEELARGRTTVTIAHRLSTVRDADQIVVVHKGQIHETGDQASLVSFGGRYAALTGMKARPYADWFTYGPRRT
jgi:ATP-binding cassette subfamily B protein